VLFRERRGGENPLQEERSYAGRSPRGENKEEWTVNPSIIDLGGGGKLGKNGYWRDGEKDSRDRIGRITPNPEESAFFLSGPGANAERGKGGCHSVSES